MTNIETTYRGHRIRYSENADEWSCYDIGTGCSNVSLQKVKARIDKMYLDLRKKAATPCFEISTYQNPTKTEGTVIEYVGLVKGRSAHKVAVVAQRRGSEKASRTEREISDLMPDTPEALAAFAEAEAAYEKVREARKVYEEAVARIPRLTLDDIADLVRVRESQEGSGDV